MFRALPGILLGSVLLIGLVAGVFFLCFQSSQTPAHKKTISVGVVAEKGEPFIDWMIDTVDQMENTKYSCRFLRLTEKKAESMMEQGKINTIFLIPENYISSIIRGENKHIIIRFSQGQTTIVSFLLRELCTAASSFILNSEAGIYTMQDYYRKYRLPRASRDELTLNLTYIRQIAELSGGVKLQEVKVPSERPQTSLFLVSGVVLFFFLWGIVYGNLLTSQNRAFRQKLTLLSLGYPVQVLLRNLAFFLVNAAGFLLLTALSFLLCAKAGFSLPDSLLSSPGQIWVWALSLLPVLWMAACFIQCVYEIAEDAVGGAIFLFFAALLLALLSGCFYPLEYLPGSVRRLAVLLPVYQGAAYGLDCLYRHFSLSHFLWNAGCGITFLGAAMCWRSLNMYRRP